MGFIHVCASFRQMNCSININKYNIEHEYHHVLALLATVLFELC